MAVNATYFRIHDAARVLSGLGGTQPWENERGAELGVSGNRAAASR